MATEQSAAAALLRRIEADWRAWLDALSGLSVEQMSESNAVGTWSIKDLMGHLGVWEVVAVESTRRLIAGETVERADWRAINTRESEARVGRTVEEQRAEMEQTHQAFVDFVAGLTTAEMRTTGVRPRLRHNSVEHYQQHTAQVQGWRRRRGV